MIRQKGMNCTSYTYTQVQIQFTIEQVHAPFDKTPNFRDTFNFSLIFSVCLSRFHSIRIRPSARLRVAIAACSARTISHDVNYFIVQRHLFPSFLANRIPCYRETLLDTPASLNAKYLEY